MGPEGGDQGGKIIATGTPEQVARNSQSHTGRFLAKVLQANGQAGQTKRNGNGASNGAEKNGGAEKNAGSGKTSVSTSTK
jgi:excinuclease ABC subunit A